MSSKRGSIDGMKANAPTPWTASPTGEALVRLPTCGVRADVVQALEHLSQTTGLSTAYIVRSVIEAHLADLGLVAPVEMKATAAHPKRRK